MRRKGERNETPRLVKGRAANEQGNLKGLSLKSRKKPEENGRGMRRRGRKKGRAAN
jgi:hypothetical protein